MNYSYLLVLFFLLLICIKGQPDASYPDRNSVDSINQDSLKQILDNIQKIKQQHPDFGNIPSNSDLDLKNPFPTDTLCQFNNDDECKTSCSNVDLCVQCFKSPLDGFGYKCLVLSP